MTLAVVLADTHLHAGSRRGLPAPVVAALDRADVVLHAGDIIDVSVLADLERYGPVFAVLGNNDVGLDLPETRVVDLDGVRVGLIHDSGPRADATGACAIASQTPTLSCSATATSRGTRRVSTVSCSSIPAHPRNGAVSPRPRSADSNVATAPLSAAESFR